jgi:hypothetical protein
MELPAIDPVELANIRLIVNELSLFDYGDTVTINEKRLQAHLDKFRYYTDDKEILSIYDNLQDIADRLNAINDRLKLFPLGHAQPGTIGYDLSSIIPITPSGFVLTWEGFKTATKKL